MLQYKSSPATVTADLIMTAQPVTVLSFTYPQQEAGTVPEKIQKIYYEHVRQ